MDTQELRLTQARFLLDRLHPELLIEFARQALEDDLDSPSLRALAGELERTKAATYPLFEHALAELGLDPFDTSEARQVLAQPWAEKILEGTVSPFDGAKAIWQECCADPVSHWERVGEFRSLASEHEDFRFAQEDGSGRYDDQLRRCEEEIVRQARLLLQEIAV